MTFTTGFEKRANAYLKAMRTAMSQQAQKIKALPAKVPTFSPHAQRLGEQMKQQYGAKKYIDIRGKG